MDLPNRLRARWFIATTMLATCLLFGACSRESLPPSDPSFAEQFAALPRLRESSNIKLLLEVRRIEQEQGFPNQLATKREPFRHWVKLSAARELPSNDRDGAAALSAVFTRGKVKRLSRDTDKLFPKRFPPWPQELRKLSERRMDNEDARALFRKVIRMPECDFGVEYDRGLLADLSFIEYVRLGADLESFYAVETLLRGQTEEAIASLESMLLAGRRLMQANHPSARLAAVEVHRRALLILQASTEQADFRDAQVRRCLALVHHQLDVWPDERKIWIVDRSDGLHAFEMIRDGYVLSVLGKAELERIDQEIGLDKFQQAVQRNVDFDQLFYLQSARQLIDACQRTYAERISAYENLANELARLRGTEKHPMISDWILLKHWQLGHRACALDKARMEAMSLALSHALGEPARKYRRNPLTGFAYRLENDDATVRVFDVGPPADDEPIVIRRREVRVGRRN